MATILSLQDVYKEFSGEKLFSPVSFIVRDHDRTAILGQNGSGKSTLIKMILGKEEVTSGSIIFSKNVKVGYLSQDVIEDVNHTLYEEALAVFKDLIQQEEKLLKLSKEVESHPDDVELLNSYSKLQTDFENKEGYTYKYKISLILNMFSFSKDDYSRKISTFSGGEKTRLAFAKLLLLNPDLLILDEPTNHLDIISIEWLEEYLKSYSGAVLFVSHDITFVKHLANHILDIENKTYTMYNTTYENFAIEKKNHYENLLAQYKAQEEEKERLNKFIKFYMPKPRFASRAHDREKKLERLENNAIDDPSKVKQRNLAINLKGEIREGKKLLDFNSVSVGYDKPLVSDINFTLFGRDRLAIMGANGIGKSTFGKVLMNELQPVSGDIRRYFHMSMGILRQDILSYQSEETLFQHFRDLYPRMENQDIYNGLARYAFSYKEANEKRLCDLSGGELMRVEILQLSLEDYDLLLLDEPTNHLDMLSISELIDALKDYAGTLVIISHDRDFIDKTCNKLLYLYHGKGYYFEGDYSSFKEKELNKIMNEEQELLLENKTNEVKTEVKEEKKKVRLTKDDPEKVMVKIDKLETKKKALMDSCYLEENYTDNDKMKEIEKEIAAIDEFLTTLYEQLDSIM